VHVNIVSLLTYLLTYITAFFYLFRPAGDHHQNVLIVIWLWHHIDHLLYLLT